MRDAEVGVGCVAVGSWCGVSCDVCSEFASPASGPSRHVSQSPVVRVTCVASPASGLYLKARLSVAGRACVCGSCVVTRVLTIRVWD